MTDALKQHWPEYLIPEYLIPEYLIEGACLGLFMISALPSARSSNTPLRWFIRQFQTRIYAACSWVSPWGLRLSRSFTPLGANSPAPISTGQQPSPSLDSAKSPSGMPFFTSFVSSLAG